ncbi:YecA family protein [Clostridium sp.]|uniref:YecA family protein n=1 Tax=Clostridium sp. TaxID=1506 RepID=UPI0034641B18
MFKDFKGKNLSTEILVSYTKNELDEIRRYYSIQGASSLKKADLATKISEYIKDNLKIIFLNYLNIEELYLIKKALYNEGIYNYDKNNTHILKALKTLGLAFPSLINNEKAIIIPTDYLLGIKNLLEDSKTEEIIILNNKALSLVKGSLYHYGVISFDDISNVLTNNFSINMDKSSLKTFLDNYSKRYSDLKIKENLLCHNGIFNIESLWNEQEKKSSLSYKPLDIKEVLISSEEGSNSWNYYENKFYTYLCSNIELPEKDIENVVNRCIIWVKNSFNLPTILNYLNTYLHFRNEGEMVLVTPYIKDLMNNSSLWILKGYSNNDIYNISSNSTMALSNKIGRNDPCPCGSGKKYKKCCSN